MITVKTYEKVARGIQKDLHGYRVFETVDEANEFYDKHPVSTRADAWDELMHHVCDMSSTYKWSDEEGSFVNTMREGLPFYRISNPYRKAILETNNT